MIYDIRGNLAQWLMNLRHDMVVFAFHLPQVTLREQEGNVHWHKVPRSPGRLMNQGIQYAEYSISGGVLS